MQPDFQWGAIGGVIGAFVTGLFAWLVQRGKGQVEESVTAIGEWQKLTSTLSAENDHLRAELAAEQKARSDQRRRHDAEMKAMQATNESLLRIIAQNAGSKAQLLGDLAAGSNGK